MEENELQIISDEEIKDLIYIVRGKQAMLDSDEANLYHYKTKRINETVNRNKERFPESFCFQLAKEELEDIRIQVMNKKNNWSQFATSSNEKENNLRSQIATSSLEKDSYGGRRYVPYVFTEQGIAMLSGLLKNQTAVQVSINIMNAFVKMRKFLKSNEHIFERLTTVEYKLLEHDKKFDKVFNQLDIEEKIKQKIFFEGQIWDSYNLIVNIIKRAESKILIIDNYIDDSILEMLSKKKNGVEVIILTSSNSNILKLDIQKFNKEYPTLKIAKIEKFHDRFIVIDNKELYHCGASLKDLGKKCFGINRIDDVDYIESLRKNIVL